MTCLNVQTSTNQYSIFIDENIRHETDKYLPKTYSSILIVTDEQVADLYLNDVKESLAGRSNVFHTVIKNGEQSKDIDTFYQLQTKGIECGLDRRSLIIALGGGVIGDLAGFVAATFMRGIDYVQLPTTILAHDSSVGGKVAINHKLGKNLIGNFYPPEAVIYDIQTLHSLVPKEIRSGYAEIVKEALIADKELFADIMDAKLSNLTTTMLKEHIFRGVQIKKHFVQTDEKEKGIRAYLNFGHTLGHALEAEYGYGSLAHGEAVAIGMLFAMEVSNDIYSINLPVDILVNWLRANNYPVHLEKINTDRVLARMKSDKKTVNDQVQMVLLSDIGNPVSVKITDMDLQNYLKSFLIKMARDRK
ncbi:3-dehydroquinate synthase [Virgibacillus phasianinus]|uniref:3-dehydroquinate synthase n=1 Tax=Virgibacillus phasianinus TaxID=2017483 RepID=A0A220U682_9BACI|nr:3-dehydroquinate synthase [Virgibacillus phasianinus]ASK63341.1 3-dehydroquinate synthase [Virgibacillus phasianinus]